MYLDDVIGLRTLVVLLNLIQVLLAYQKPAINDIAITDTIANKCQIIKFMLSPFLVLLISLHGLLLNEHRLQRVLF